LNNFIEMDYDEWVDTYKPIPNNIDKNASFDGMMFETYGAEVEFVKKAHPNFEDPDNTIRDAFDEHDLYKCPQCATLEEMTLVGLDTK